MNNARKVTNKKVSSPYLKLFALVLAIIVTGCTDQAARYKALSTFFDGVPILPAVDDLCRDQKNDLCKEYFEEMTIAATGGKKIKQTAGSKIRSIHPPYAQKNCQGCHDFKSANLLIRPKNQLCFVCHKNFIKGSNVHGPVSVGACLACHFPHDSQNTFLLRREKTALCAKCHQEKRLAYNMHVRVIEHHMACVDCHDPHSANAKYFLK